MRLFEIEDIELKLEISEFKRLVLDHCSDFYNTIKGSDNLLYRGFNSLNNKKFITDSIFYGTSRTDRKPRSNMSLKFQQLYDNYLFSKGIKALRRNSIPTISDVNATLRFGNSYIIFPCNGFEWSTQDVRDVGASHHDDLLDRNTTSTLEFLDKEKIKSFEIEWGIEFDWNKPWATNEYRAYLAHTDKGDLDIEDYVNQEKMNYLLDHHYNASNKDLVKAMTSHREILISGSYYAIKANQDTMGQLTHWIK